MVYGYFDAAHAPLILCLSSLLDMLRLRRVTAKGWPTNAGRLTRSLGSSWTTQVPLDACRPLPQIV
jgi:hypothetical protein